MCINMEKKKRKKRGSYYIGCASHYDIKGT